MVQSQDERNHILSQFSPHLDSGLITAILDEPGQSQSVAIQTLTNLVESISGLPFTYQPQPADSTSVTPNERNLSDPSHPTQEQTRPRPDTKAAPSRRGGGTASRRGFQGKLTQEALDAGFAPQAQGSGKTPTTSRRPSKVSAEAQLPEPSAPPRDLQPGSADVSGSQPFSRGDTHQEDLEEQERNEAEIKLDLERLKLLDRLDDEEEQRRRLIESQVSEDQSPEAAKSSSSSNAEANPEATANSQNQVLSPTLSTKSSSASSSGAEESLSLHDVSSSNSSLTDDSYDGKSEATSEADSLPSGRSSDESLAFLQTVFPNSSKTSLRIALEACDGDVPLALDLLTAQALAEEEEIAVERERNNAHITQDGINGLTWDEIEFHSGESTKGNGLNDALLEQGIRPSPSSPSLGNASLGWSEAGMKGKKGRNARRKAKEEELATRNGTLISSGTGKDSSKTIINLTDVRHGAPIKNRNVPLSRLSSSASSSSTSLAGLEQKFFALDPKMTQGMSDEEIARRLNDEERELNGDGPSDAPVTDNSWLLTSSVLSQLSTLLDLPSENITSVYNLSSFNLAITFSRLLTHSSDQFSLEDLDQTASAPSGTALGLVKGISSLTGASQKDSEKAFRATKGRQDSTIDLLQLWKTVIQTADPRTLPDELDPLGRLRDDGAKKANANALVSTPNANSVNVGGNIGRFSSVGDGFPSLTGSLSSSTQTSSSGISQYAKAALRNTSNNSSASPAALALASGASSISLPLSSSKVSHPSDSELLSMSSADINSLQLSYAECRAKEESYRLKADSYRHSAGQAYRKAKGGPNAANGLGAGGIAWYYANEVTRMDNMRYEWGKRAALALVRDRQRSSLLNLNHNTSHLGSYSSTSHMSGSGHSSRNVVDLHGLTKQEAISVIEKCLNSWWSQPSHGGSLQTFSIITGAGRHSRGGISVLKPAIKKWLDHNGWKIARDTDEGVLRVLGTK